MAQTAEFQPLTHEGELRALAAVNHEKVLAVVYHQRRGLVFRRGFGRSASERMYGEGRHMWDSFTTGFLMPLRGRW